MYIVMNPSKNAIIADDPRRPGWTVNGEVGMRIRRSINELMDELRDNQPPDLRLYGWSVELDGLSKWIGTDDCTACEVFRSHLRTVMDREKACMVPLYRQRTCGECSP